MSENPAPVFTGGRNVAIKVPEHAFEATVAFYRDTLALAIVYDAVGTKAFEFGPIRLWIDRMPHLAQGEMWLELRWPATRRRPPAHLKAAGVVRCNEVEEAAAGPGRILDPQPRRHRASGLLAGGRGAGRRRRHPRRRKRDVGRGVSRPLATTARAQAGQLNRGAVDPEGGPLDAPRQRRTQLLVVDLGRIAAIAANEKVGLVGQARLGTADIGVEPIDPVDQPFAAEEFQRAVDRRRRHAPPARRQLVEDLVGADRRVAAPDQLQDPLAQLGEPGPSAGAQVLGAAHGRADAAMVVVRRLGKGSSVAGVGMAGA